MAGAMWIIGLLDRYLCFSIVLISLEIHMKAILDYPSAVYSLWYENPFFSTDKFNYLLNLTAYYPKIAGL